jgi:hypothetical protein
MWEDCSRFGSDVAETARYCVLLEIQRRQSFGAYTKLYPSPICLGRVFPMNALDHDTGVEVLDLQSNAEFLARPSHQRDALAQLTGMQRLAHAFTENADGVLQELCDIAVQLCGAESAGISLEIFGPEGQQLFQWVAISGVYAPFLNATVPYHWMPCGVCLDRSQPQTLRVPVAHFAAMGLEELPPPITDGILLPWHVGSSRGTIWVLAHGRTDAFDQMDYDIMQMFSDFAAMAVRNQQQQKTILQQTRAAAAADMANGLAHQINNPLQKLTNSIFLADTQSADAPGHIKQASNDLQQLSSLVQQLLALSDKA